MLRRIAVAALATLLAVTPALAASPELTRIIGLNWSGVSEQKADFTESGKVVLAQSMSLSVDASDNITGRAKTTMTLDGVTYRAEFRVSGTFDGRDGLRLSSSLVANDPLPHDLRWCSGESNLRIYKDADRSGHFILRGTVDDSCGGRSELELLDK